MVNQDFASTVAEDDTFLLGAHAWRVQGFARRLVRVCTAPDAAAPSWRSSFPAS